VESHKIVYRRCVLIVSVDGLSIEGGEASRSYLKALENGSVEPATTELFRRAVQPGMVVVDVGAFLGQYSLLAARQVGAAGKVFAFEPDPRNVVYLARNVEQNGLGDRTTVVPKAVSDTSAEVAFYLDPEVGSGSSLVYRRRRTVATETVRTVTLDEFLGNAITPDLIKLDIEGGEIRALGGMEKTIPRAGPDLAMFVECFPKALRTAGGGTHALVQRLEHLGFWIYVIDEDRKRVFPITSRRSSLWAFYVYLGFHSLLVVNLLCVRRPDHPLLTNAP
jgi:FkbM family methyltransferase